MQRILTLDGGGIRGIVSLEILRQIEALFRAEHGRNDLVLADVIDLFAGTSTGAIIGTCLAWGMPVEDIEQLYIERAAQMFARAPWHQRWRSSYRGEAIGDFFRSTFTDDAGNPALLGTSRLRSLLLVVMRNASTGSPWPVTNHPDACFNNRALPECNLDIPLWQLLRASTAAPTFFPPEEIRLGDRTHMFVDGGITPYNNPALIAVLMTTLPQYRIGWPAGCAALHVISVGTGRSRIRLPPKLARQIHLLDQVAFVGPALISAAAAQQDMLCRVLGDCIYGEDLDSEVGQLCAPTLLARNEQKFTYVRYDCQLDDVIRDGSAAALPVRLDDITRIPTLRAIGAEYARRTVCREHLCPRQPLESAYSPEPPA